jgi:hypothetical protein
MVRQVDAALNWRVTATYHQLAHHITEEHHEGCSAQPNNELSRACECIKQPANIPVYEVVIYVAAFKLRYTAESRSALRTPDLPP